MGRLTQQRHDLRRRIRRSHRRNRSDTDPDRGTRRPLLDYPDRRRADKCDSPLGSATGTPGGKFLLVGPDWDGELPEDFLDVLRSPTNVAGVFPRSFAARSEASKQQARSVLDQIGMYPFSEDRPGPRSFGYEAHAANSIYPQGVTAEMLAVDPDASRPQWVKPESFWTDLAAMLDFNPTMGAADTPMADQAKTLVALYRSDKSYRALLDRAALRADVALHQSARLRPNRGRRRQRMATATQQWPVGHRLVRTGARGRHLHLRQRLSRGCLPHPGYRPRRSVTPRPRAVHHDPSQKTHSHPSNAVAAASGL